MQQAVLVSWFLWQLAIPSSTTTQPPEEPTLPGVLTVTATSSRDITAPRGAQRVPVLSLRLDAECGAGDITIQELHLERRGPGFASDIAAVTVEMHQLRVSGAATVPRDGNLTLRLRNVVIPACSSRQLFVLVDIASDASAASLHRINLATNHPVRSDATRTVLSFIDTHVQDTPTVRTSPFAAGSVHVAFPSLTQTLRYGKNRTVARLRISAQKHDQLLHAITLTNQGTASDSDIQAIRLTDAQGNPLTRSADALVGKRVRLVFDPPYRLPRGKTILLHTRADIHAGASRTIRFSLEEPSDFVVETVRGRRK